ncbi:pseudouridine synthase [Backusella circina FSU 941]|nr:pseudouridine synthase [Backusella circina FSU 941]
MGLSWSKEARSEVVDAPVIVTVEKPVQVGQKRAAEPETASTSKKKKHHKNQKKDKGPKRETVQTRPQQEGPREPRVPKRKVALMIGFNGTGFQGMQFNPDARSIESELFTALCKAGAISKDNSDDYKKSQWMRAARTDKGVHAAGNVISLKMQLPEDYDIIERINSFLPDQLRVWGYVQTINSFHAKTLCDSRIYEYLLPTFVFMPAEKRPMTDEQVNETDIPISDNNYPNPIIKYVARSTPEFLAERDAYRATPEQLETFKAVMNKFQGTHNFHNYTVGKGFKERSANRYMLSIDVSDPLYINNTEWISIKLHGQSFMLHQIRKMISMGLLLVRSGTPLSLIDETFNEKRINIPKAPALGLLLERPLFGVYNEKLLEKANQVTREKISFDPYKEKIEEFKQKWIYDKIFESEKAENVFDTFLTSLDAHLGNDYDYLNADGIIPDSCIIQTKHNPKEKSKAKEEEDDE